MLAREARVPPTRASEQVWNNGRGGCPWKLHLAASPFSGRGGSQVQRIWPLFPHTKTRKGVANTNNDLTRVTRPFSTCEPHLDACFGGSWRLARAPKVVRGIFAWRTLEARESIAIWGSAKAFVFFAAAYHEGKNEKSNGVFSCIVSTTSLHFYLSKVISGSTALRLTTKNEP